MCIYTCIQWLTEQVPTARLDCRAARPAAQPCNHDSMTAYLYYYYYYYFYYFYYYYYYYYYYF